MQFKNKLLTESILVRLSLLFALLLISSAGRGDIMPYADDFESYNPADSETLFVSGWIVFGNVTNFDFGSYLYGYGPNPAPNDGGGFSGVAVNEGGPAQGAQQLNTFNDYNNTDHNNPSLLIEANIYQEQTIGAANVGQTWQFNFDVKLGNLASPSTALAFIKTIDPNNGFAQTNFAFVVTTSTSVQWRSHNNLPAHNPTISLEIDAGLVGQLFQFGFANTASSFFPTGVFYDNVSLVLVTNEIDNDSDGVSDDTDNCSEISNPNQRDTDADGIGNVCDPDVAAPNDCTVNFLDLNVYRANFFQAGDLDTDNNGDGQTNFADLNIVRTFFFSPPGPSANGCN